MNWVIVSPYRISLRNRLHNPSTQACQLSCFKECLNPHGEPTDLSEIRPFVLWRIDLREISRPVAMLKVRLVPMAVTDLPGYCGHRIKRRGVARPSSKKFRSSSSGQGAISDWRKGRRRLASPFGQMDASSPHNSADSFNRNHRRSDTSNTSSACNPPPPTI